MLLEKRTALAFGHPAPDTEFHPVVEGVGAAFEDHRAVTADDGGFALGGAAYEQLVRVSLTASGLGHPSNTGLGFCTVDNAVC